ncbi:resolvase [Flavobacterium sp. HSC-61S13]|uniref:resolvase n=1 Tax=Flavobacterium sp. HSC-61S13 TaxID=2910963 RepID=UPI00209F5707|nr:resolvase [Flavobacterium sp. HSC-61S13]MCP1997340.1 hypothetical protein [Flavobacterium sp. HSC-61S13]
MKIAYPFFIAAVVTLFIGCQSQTKNTESIQEVTQITKKNATFTDFKKVKGVNNVLEVPFELTTQLDSIRFFTAPNMDAAQLKIAYNKFDNYYGFEEFDNFYSIHYSINNNISNSIEAFVLKSEFTAAFDMTLEGVDLYQIRSSMYKAISDVKTKSFEKYGSITEVSEAEFKASSKNRSNELLVKNPLIQLKDGNWVYSENTREVIVTQHENISTEDGYLSNEYIGQSPYLHLEIFKEYSAEVTDTYYSFYQVKNDAEFKLFTAGYPQILPALKWISYISSNDDVGSNFEVGKFSEKTYNQESLLYVNFTNFKIANETTAFWADNNRFYAEVFPVNSKASKGKKQKSAFIKIQLKTDLF